MADNITTDADLMSSGYILANDKERLTPEEWTDGSWLIWHKEAWNEILRNLASRPDAIEEDEGKRSVWR